MADVKWIKITTDIFDDEKVLMIESMPSADSIIVIWFKLLTFAGKQNNDGVFLMSNRIAYTDEMLASIFRRDVNTIRLALKAFEQFGMIEIVDNVITIPNWNKHQTLDAYEKKKERDRLYQAERRAAQKALVAGSNTPSMELPAKEWDAVLKEFNHQCAYCGSSGKLEQEHIVPMIKGGKYEIGNIVPACRRCNASKQDKPLIAWYSTSEVFDADRLHHILEYMKSSDESSDKSPDIVVSEEDKEREEDKEEDKERESNVPDKNVGNKPTRHKYGEYKNVLLTDEDLEKLKAEFTDWEARIERLSSYIAQSGKSYKNHLATIRNWAKKDKESGKDAGADRRGAESNMSGAFGTWL